MLQNFSEFLIGNLSAVILTFFVVVLLSITWGVYLYIQVLRLKNKHQVFFEGKDGKDLEDLILRNNQEIEKLDKDIEDLYQVSDKINKIALKGIQKVGLVRFNPFKDTGGNQSFVLALLDASNNGVIISSLYTRQETRIYSKPISSGVSPYQLSEEEKEAIKKALELK